MKSEQDDRYSLAISYALPPSLYPQSIQIGRLLYHSTLRIASISGKFENTTQSMDCYSDFSQRMHFHLKIQYRALFPTRVHNLARFFLPLYARAPDEFIGWAKEAERAILDQFAKEPELPDQIISFGEPMSDHLLGHRLKKITGLPWVAHFSDPWVDNPFRKFFFLSNIWNRHLEAIVVRSADKLIFTSSETLSLVMSKYPSAWTKKAYVLTHSYDPASYPQVPAPRNGKIMVRYLGSFYGIRTPYPLLLALEKMMKASPESLKDVCFEFIGGIPTRMLRNRLVRSLPTDLIKFLPSVSYHSSLRLMKESDLLLVIDAPAKLSVFLPSKLVDYIGAGVPIAGIVPQGSSANLIQRMGGSVANPDNIQEIMELLKKNLDEVRRRRSTGEGFAWGNEEVRKEFAIEGVGKKFLGILSAA